MALSLGGRTFYPKMPVDHARRYFLLVICKRPNVGPAVTRAYLQEKIEQVWRCADANEVLMLLDQPGQQVFKDLAWADGFTP